ncbi:MAG: cbb3-type cytochrome c oxidase subunit II [Candidatus Rokubacteria bacterium]|nr:cbb3-type cytochrome c oxidase subunit II [Candidatus Rokubacteria bacterium]
MKSIASLAVGAGFACITLAMFVQGVLPALIPESRSTRVTRAVRTDLGEVKWVRADAVDYSEAQARGRRVYIREGCWYCHSQYVRPVTQEDLRWGPVSEAGEYAYDLPHLFSTRRIGPDLTRVGLKFADDWHYAHHWDPRLVVPDSIMPTSRWLYHATTVRYAPQGTDATLEPTAELRRWFTFNPRRSVLLVPNAAALTFVPPLADGRLPIDATPVVDLAHLKPPPSTLRLVTPKPELVDLVRYLQKLGTNRGVWRDVFEPQTVGVTAMTVPDRADLVARGGVVYRQRCVGCHGPDGDGNGAAATFLSPRPRDFTAAVFKFRSTPSGSLPTDGDLFRTVTRGVRWTAMPTWHELPDKDRLAVVAFIKGFSTRWREEKPEPPLHARPPAATPALVARGAELYVRAKCWECHGEDGRGDGPSAAQLKDDGDRPVQPTDFTRGQLKGGAQPFDVFRTMTNGLDGTPMPSFADTMTDDERWAISYYVLSLSAWADPLTGEKLALPRAARETLNSTAVAADHPQRAWSPDGETTVVRRRHYGGISD